MDLSFFEMVMIGVIAFLVLGPEEMVRKAQTLGRWLGKMKADMNNFKVIAKEELLNRIDEGDKLKKTLQQPLQSLGQSLSQTLQEDVMKKPEGDGHESGKS